MTRLLEAVIRPILDDEQREVGSRRNIAPSSTRSALHSVGLHIQHQVYLGHFSCPSRPSHIWIFDKKVGQWLGNREIPIRGAMQAPGFYADQDEKFLAGVEGNGIGPLQKLCREEALTPEDREAVANYVVAAFTRSPWVRRAVIPVAQKHKEELKQNLSSYLAERGLPDTAAYRGAAAEWLDVQNEELDKGAYRSRHENVTTAPSEYFRHTFFHSAVRGMGWRVLRRPDSTGFATSDSPSLPRGREEFQFPLSTRLCLVGASQWPKGSLNFEDCPGRAARIINTNTVTMAERFIGFHRKAEWIPRAVGGA